MEESRSVRLRKPDGNIINIAMDELSADEREWITKRGTSAVPCKR